MSTPTTPDHRAADHYATLGVADSATHTTIRAAYRHMIRAVHPDVARDDPGATARALAVNSAWAVLRDPTRRAAYDRERAGRRSTAPGGGDVPDGVARVGEGRPRSTAATPAGPPSWRPGGVRPVTREQLREAAVRETAYSARAQEQRLAFSAASLRIGLLILLLGTVMLALVVAR